MITAVIAEPTPELALQRVDELVREWGVGGLFVEIRLDAMTHPDPDIVGRIPYRVIATCRPRRTGGWFAGSEEERLALLSRAASAGAAYVDQELEVTSPLTLPWDARRIVSFHDFDGVPDDAALETLVSEGFSSGADVVKIACRPHNLEDLMRLRRAAAGEPGAVVVVGLGSTGLVSRVLYESLGSPWTYAYAGTEAGRERLNTGLPTVTGLMALRGRTSSKTALQVAERWAPPRRVFGIVGDRAEDSIGPRVYGQLFRRWGIDATYLPITTDSLDGLASFMENFDITGLSVTTPFKEQAAALADRCREPVKALGAANTIVRSDEGLVASNSDVVGVAEPLFRLFGETGEGATAWVVGAGGAGRAAALALVRMGFDVHMSGRTAGRSEASAARVGVTCGEPGASPDVIVNATPAGSPRAPDDMPVTVDRLRAGQVVFEMNYTGTETPLVHAALEKGARVVTGSEMFTAQAWQQVSSFLGEVSGSRTDLDHAVQEALA